MRLLLDTHTFLWLVEGDPQLSTHARSLIQDPNNRSQLSPVVHWEIAIKVSIGKLALSVPFPALMAKALSRHSFQILPIEIAHTIQGAALAFHHKDPFDRMLIAQAMVEQIPIV